MLASRAYAINSSGTAVGFSEKLVASTNFGSRATMWLANSTAAIDLNDLNPTPTANEAGGVWVLQTATAISDTGYIAGEGTFDPDGVRPLNAYRRLWVAFVAGAGLADTTAPRLTTVRSRKAHQ